VAGDYGPAMLVYLKVATSVSLPRRSDRLSCFFVAGDYDPAMLVYPVIIQEECL